MLVSDGKVEGQQMELYDSGASCHMSPYRDHFENYVKIIPKPIVAADKRCFQAIGKGDLRVKIPNGPKSTTILLKEVLHCPDMGLTLVSIGKITSAGYKVIFKRSTIEEFHRRMGHISPETAKRMVSEGVVKGVELNSNSTIQTCDSCEYAKMTRKPIKRARQTPRASKFGDEIHSDVWGPLPVKTPEALSLKR